MDSVTHHEPEGVARQCKLRLSERGSHLPEKVLATAGFGVRLGKAKQWILDKTEIEERRIAAKDEATSDLAIFALLKVIEDTRISLADIDVIVLATATKDQPIPSTACRVQGNLGAMCAAAFDIESGSREELPLPAPSDPDVKLSLHPAPVVPVSVRSQ
ncbi:hypothetical protein [Haloechinothrix salitolerans]|uniref:3-oxoacyl-ACP synthase III family protein n=1 Tax=Haloechinothrix salitolerans TaxID=926830 RepID=A0ABW2C064_9PSEU